MLLHGMLMTMWRVYFSSIATKLIVSYGELDCYATLARFPLAKVLNATLNRKKADNPPRALR